MFVHLVLHTNNVFTLNIIADNIKQVFGDILIDINKYSQFPIALEKLCNLLNKVIIIATPEYKLSKLKNYIIPK